MWANRFSCTAVIKRRGKTWSSSAQITWENISIRYTKVQTFIRLFQFTLEPLTFTDISSKLLTTLLMPQPWMHVGAEAVKMATEDRFDITKRFKLINDREVDCGSNDEITETKLPYQLQQLQPCRCRSPPRAAPAINQAPYCTYHKNNSSHLTSECLASAHGRRPAPPSNFQTRRSPQTAINT